MKSLSRSDADLFLSPLGLRIGRWNELTDERAHSLPRWSWEPPKDARSLYESSEKLAGWICDGGRIFFQIDNSTSLLAGQSTAFESFALESSKTWSIDTDRSFILEEIDERLASRVTLLIFFSILFEWHVHLVSDESTDGTRLSLQDGIVHVTGDREKVALAQSNVEAGTRS